MLRLATKQFGNVLVRNFRTRSRAKSFQPSYPVVSVDNTLKEGKEIVADIKSDLKNIRDQQQRQAVVMAEIEKVLVITQKPFDIAIWAEEMKSEINEMNLHSLILFAIGLFFLGSLLSDIYIRKNKSGSRKHKVHQ